MQYSSRHTKSLQYQLFITITSLIVVVLVLITGLIALYSTEHLNTDLQQNIIQLKTQLEDKGRIFSRQARVSLNQNLTQINLAALQKTLNKLVAENDELDFAVLMSKERTAYAHTLRPELQTRTLDDTKSLQLAITRSPQVIEYSTQHGTYLETANPVRLGNKHWGVLRLGFSLSSIESMTHEKQSFIKKAIYWTVFTSSLVAILFIIIGWFIARRISTRITTPLQTLTREAEGIIAGNYHSLANTEKNTSFETIDEIAQLSNVLQEMGLHLERSQKAVKEYIQHLEQKIDTRTIELELARQQVDMANTLKGEFLANMSHEIRTPLNAVMGLTLLLNQTPLTPRQQGYTRKLASSGENLLAIINDVLDFSNIEAGMLQLEKLSFNVDDILDDVVKSIIQPAHEKGLELIIDIKDSLPEILIGDPARLRQVFLNLLNNAVKFTECGEIIISVEIVESNDRCIELRCNVTDSGIGMSAEQSAQLFKTFTHADSTISRRNGGTGLGLTISKKLVEMMNGKIAATSTYGIGSEFSFTATFSIPSQPRPSEPLTNVLLPILLIDNHSPSSNAMARMLKRLGCAVTQINSSPKGLDDIEHASKTGQPYQLVIIKADMPQLRGEEAAELIKTNTKLTSTPKILLLSRHTDANGYSALIGSSIDALLSSPVTENNLKLAIKRLLAPIDQITFTESTVTKRSFEGLHLLLAEDDETNQQVTTELLRNRGIEVTIANNGREVLDLLLGKNPIAIDGILMDIQMPEMDGYETTSRLRQDPRYKTLPIIGLTAHISDEEKQRCIEKGMQAHLPKPIVPDNLFSSIDRLVTPPATSSQMQKGQFAKITADGFSGINLKEGLQRVGDNTTIYIRIAKQFIAEHSDVANNIRQQLLIKQLDSAETLTHSLLGAAASIGATELAYSAHTLKHAIKSKQSDAAIARQLKEFDGVKRATMESLHSIIQHLEVTGLPDAKSHTIRSVLPSNERIKILLVDDNLTNLEVLKQQLSIIGYESDPCQDGSEAWEKWQTGNYHLILTDINMPGIDGYELTRRVREYEAGKSHTPIIAFTATTSRSDANRCMKVGMDEFLIKPMALDELKQVLKKWLPKELFSLTNERTTHQAPPTYQKTAWPETPDSAIDIIVLIQVVGDDINIHRNLFESFVKSAESAVSAINTAVERNAIEVISKQAHKLKSASRNMGAMKLADLCEAMEGAARAGQQQKIVSLLPSLNRLFDDVQTFVASYIETTLPA